MSDICWVDINDRLPEKTGTYLVTLRGFEDEYCVNTRIFTKGSFRNTFGTIVSWAAMPDPYVPERD